MRVIFSALLTLLIVASAQAMQFVKGQVILEKIEAPSKRLNFIFLADRKTA